MNSIAQVPEKINTLLADGVHPYDDPEDQWVVVVNLEQVARAPTEATGWIAYNEIVRVECDVVTLYPANGLGAWWTVRTADFTASVARDDNEVSYEDHS